MVCTHGAIRSDTPESPDRVTDSNDCPRSPGGHIHVGNYSPVID